MQQEVTLAWIAVVSSIGAATVSGIFLVIVAFVQNRHKKTNSTAKEEEPPVLMGLPVAFDPMQELLREKDERLEECQAEIKMLRERIDALFRERNMYLHILYREGIEPPYDTLGGRIGSGESRVKEEEQE